MSRVYFHSPSGQAELCGSERAWLGHLAEGPATAAWDLDRLGGLDRAVEIVSMVPEVPDGQYGSNYLHTYMREALRQDRANREAIGRGVHSATDYETHRRFVQALQTRLSVNGVELVVAGVRLHSRNIGLNTALVAGSDPVRLAAKVHGWCESHCWVEGPDRAWMADIIDQGLKAGLYRRGMYYEDRDGERRWLSQGWEDVQALLRSRDDEPVVLSYSVCEQFPNPEAGGLPPWPEGVPEKWDSLSEDQQREFDQRREEWHAFDDAEQWRIGMEWLRRERPWARLSADTLAEVYFHFPVTVYDLFAPDRDARVHAAAGLDHGESSAVPGEDAR